MGYTSFYAAKDGVKELSQHLKNKLPDLGKVKLSDQRLMYGHDKVRAAFVVYSDDTGYVLQAECFAEDDFDSLAVAISNFLNSGFNNRVLAFAVDRSQSRWRAMLVYAKYSTVEDNSISAFKSDSTENAEKAVNGELSNHKEFGGFDTLYANQSFYSIVVGVTA